MDNDSFETLVYIKDKICWELKVPNFEDEQKRINFVQNYNHLLNQFQSIQNKMFLKFPYFQQIKIAKIKILKHENHIQKVFVKYYYEELNQEIIYIDEQSDVAQFSVQRTFPLKQNSQQEMDSNLIKNLNQCLIESFHWAANFGFYMDPNLDSILIQKIQDHDTIIYLPTFKYFLHYIINQDISYDNILQYREKHFQNLTSYMIFQIIKEYQKNWPLKQQDEDRELYESIASSCQVKPKDSLSAEFQNTTELNQIGCDRLFAREQVKKKMWRYNFRYSLLLYCMSNTEFKNLYLKYKDQDNQIVLDKLKNNQSDQNKLQSFKQSQNLYNYFQDLQLMQIKNGFGLDVLTSFGKKIIKNSHIQPQNENINQQQFGQFCRPDWKNIVINMRFNFKSVSTVAQPTIEYYQSAHQFKIFSQIPQSNIIYQVATQSSLIEQQQIKSLFVPFRIELLESKLCYIFKTTINEIVFSIDTADDIMFLINMIQREDGSTNLYVDEQRKLTLYTTIVQGQHIEIMPAVIKVLDIHTIYFYLLLDFHAKNIALGRSTRELKYLSFVREIQHYVADYENDFKEIMKNITENDIWF